MRNRGFYIFSEFSRTILLIRVANTDTHKNIIDFDSIYVKEY